MDEIFTMTLGLLGAILDFILSTISMHPGACAIIFIATLAGIGLLQYAHRCAVRELKRQHESAMDARAHSHKANLEAERRKIHEASPEGQLELLQTQLAQLEQTQIGWQRAVKHWEWVAGCAIEPKEIPKGVVLRLIQKITVGDVEYWVGQNVAYPLQLRLLYGVPLSAEPGWLISVEHEGFPRPAPVIKVGAVYEEADVVTSEMTLDSKATH